MFSLYSEAEVMRSVADETAPKQSHGFIQKGKDSDGGEIY
jgi:hypothetical protein